MTFEHLTLTEKHSRSWDTFVGYSPQGRPQFNTETQHLELSNFDEYFIHYLSDQLPSLTIDPDSDGIARLSEFKEMYIQTLLSAKHEYVKDSYTPP